MGLHGAHLVPRSQAEAYSIRAGDYSKHRQLPCKTFISSGTCPFRERCDYLHDPRCLAKHVKSKTKRRKEEDNASDTFYWPSLPQEHIRKKKDGNSMVVQHFVVPIPQNDEYYYHDASLYSLWSYFVEFCVRNTDGTIFHTPSIQQQQQFDEVNFNRFTGKRRLKTFISISHGQSQNSLNQNWDENYTKISHPLSSRSSSSISSNDNSECDHDGHHRDQYNHPNYQYNHRRHHFNSIDSADDLTDGSVTPPNFEYLKGLSSDSILTPTYYPNGIAIL